MDKKKKIIIGSVVGVILLGVAILFSVGSKDDSVVTNKGDVVQEDNSGSSQENVEEVNSQDSSEANENNQHQNDDKKLQQANDNIITPENTNKNNDELNEILDDKEVSKGANLEEFEKGLIDLGYTIFQDNMYDYFLDDSSIVLVDFSGENIKFNITDKSYVNHEAIKQAIQLLIPNKIEDLYKSLNNNEYDISMSIDNRTVSLISNNNGLILEITK